MIQRLLNYLANWNIALQKELFNFVPGYWLFLLSLIITVFLVSSENFLLRQQSLATLSSEIFDNQNILFRKIRDNVFERMEYYAFDADPGKPSIWRLRGRRSPVEAIQSSVPRRIEIAIGPQYRRLVENGTLHNMAIISLSGEIIFDFAPAIGQSFMQPGLAQQLSASSFKRRPTRLYSIRSNIQQFIVFQSTPMPLRLHTSTTEETFNPLQRHSNKTRIP